MNENHHQRKQLQTVEYEPLNYQETIDDAVPGNGLHKSGFLWPRLFGNSHPYDEIEWEKRTAKITKGDGTTVFEQNNVEVPVFWTQTATDIVASKYFRGQLNSSEREFSVKQMVDRVADTMANWGLKDSYFASPEDAENFALDLKWILVNQYAAFNSPVWFNVGVHERPQSSACQPHRSLISSPEGFFKIGEIVENKLIGLPVYDSTGTTKVVAVKNNGIKTVYKIILRNGTFIETTGDHLVKAVYERRTKPSWIRADQLKKGMRLQLYPHRAIANEKTKYSYISQTLFNAITIDGQVITRSVPVLGSELESRDSQLEISEAALAGWLQADGFVGQYFHGTNQSLTVEFLAVNEEEKEWIETHLDVVFPHIHRKVRVTKTRWGTSITRIRLYGTGLKYFVEKYDLLKRREKIRVPDVMWKSSPNVIVSYLRSVFQGEGYISIRKIRKEESGRLAIATISKDWMYDIQILLYGLGIYSRVIKKTEKRADRQDLYEVVIGVGSEKKKFSESGEYLTNNVAVHNCFILSVEDNMQSILDWYRDEGWIFKYGSGAGTNLSKLRSSKEPLSKGGFSSGPVSFMKGADGVANSIRSGGTTRRAAKMVVLNVDHPDIKNFIYCKKIIEDMTKALAQSGIKDSIEADIFDPYTLLPYQNANNSVRVTDEFMKAVENDSLWDLKAITTGESLERIRAREVMDWITDAAWHSADPGVQYDTTINNWHTLTNTGRINASNPCSEYLSIDNSACNLASLNLLKFTKDSGGFDVDLFRKAVDTIILAMDIIVDNSSYPTEKITQNARDYRQLGLGYANLGSLLMVMGLPYDSEKGRVVAGQITSLLCGEAYRMSSLVADIKGPFAGFDMNKESMLSVIEKHTDEAEKLYRRSVKLNTDDEDLLNYSRIVWNDALNLGKKYGIRNSQATVLAPTGTISFMLDCDTTGIEPELALVKYKKLVGGGTLKLVNGQVSKALQKLGYSEEQIDDVTNYLLEKETIEGAPHFLEEDLPVFDCSFKAMNGQRSIGYMGHVKMMAAAQPFISGAISKTVNLPSDATREDIKDVYIQGWKLGLKAIAVYRDGCKSIQPLNTSDKQQETSNKNLVEKVNGYTRIKLPDERPSITHKFSVGGFESYLTVGFYPDTGKPGETFITTAKEGSTVSGLFDTIATLVSMCLQSGVPLKTLVKKFKDIRFEPAGFTNNPDIPTAKSIMDYIFRYIGMRYLNPEEREEIFGPGTGSNGSYSAQIEKQNEPVLASAPTTIDSKTVESAVATSMDAPACVNCGSLMIKAGSCYSCPNCFTTTGVCN